MCYATLMGKDAEKFRAIEMRRHGKTYNEILDKVPVAKSTLSLWLRSVQLSKPQVQRTTALRKAAAQRGADSRRNARLAEIKSLTERGIKKVGKMSRRELWLVGIALYWAEGNKQRQSSISSGIIFGNSDPQMIRVFLAWLEALNITRSQLIFELYVHETRFAEVDVFKRWWAKEIGITRKEVTGTYFKKGNVLTNHKNTEDLYHGLLRLKVKSSTSLNREITGYIAGVVASV